MRKSILWKDYFWFRRNSKTTSRNDKETQNLSWKNEKKESFAKIKEAIVEAPTLQSPNFDKEFILYTFSSDHSIVVVLTWKDKVGEEFPVSFMSAWLQGVEVNYPAIDTQAFALLKVVKHLWLYIRRSHTKIIVPHSAVRYLLIQKELGDRWGNWMASLQEYDLEIKQEKLVKGQGLWKLVVESLDLQEEEGEEWEKEVDMLQREVL